MTQNATAIKPQAFTLTRVTIYLTKPLAIDTISVSSPVSGIPLNEGLKFHQIVLRTNKNKHERYILLTEDVKLEPQLGELKRVMVVPLYLQDADGALVVILAEVN